MKPSPRYSLFSSAIHWLMAVLIIALLIIGWSMGQLPDNSDKYALMGLHKSLGVLALMLIVLRIPGRVISKLAPRKSSPFETGLRHLAHSLLYLMMIIMPLSGVMMSWTSGRPTNFFSLLSIPGASEKIPSLASAAHSIHVTVSYGFAAVITLHVATFLYTQYIKKDNILHRISLRL